MKPPSSLGDKVKGGGGNEIRITVLITIIVPLTLFPSDLMWLVPLSSSTVILYSFYFLETHRDRFYVDSGVHLLESNQFHNRLTVVYSHLTHTHPSHSQTSLLLTSSLSLGVPVPHVRDGGLRKGFRCHVTTMMNMESLRLL